MYKAIFQSLLNLRFSDEMQPNYVTNVEAGQLLGGLAVSEQQDGLVSYFDSTIDITQLLPSQAMIAHLLEQQTLGDYDSIHAQLHPFNE